MNKEYICPVCGHPQRGLSDELYPFFCDYCGWDDDDEMRGMETGGVNGRFAFETSVEMVRKGKNIEGGTLPWSEWIKNRELTKC